MSLRPLSGLRAYTSTKGRGLGFLWSAFTMTGTFLWFYLNVFRNGGVFGVVLAAIHGVLYVSTENWGL